MTEWYELFPSDWQKRYSKPSSWCSLKDSQGRQFTIQNYGYAFKGSQYLTSDVDREGTRVERYSPTWIHPNSIVALTGDCQHVAWQLGRLQHGILGAVRITPEQVEKELVDCLDSNRYTRTGKRVVRVYWVTDTFLERKPLHTSSRWITLSTPNVDEYFTKSAEQFQQEQTDYRVFVETEQTDQKIADQIDQALQDETFVDKLKKKLKLR